MLVATLVHTSASLSLGEVRLMDVVTINIRTCYQTTNNKSEGVPIGPSRV